MKIPTRIKYYESYIPYRCRKPRYKEVVEIVKVNIRELTMDKLKLKYSYDSSFGHYDLYEHNSKLYRAVEINDICSGGFNENYSTVIEAFKYWHLNGSYFYAYNLSVYTKKDIIGVIKKAYSEYLVVDGILYIKEDKPLYYIPIFGSGNSYIRTDWIFITSRVSAKKLNKIHERKCYFEPEEYDEAYHEAIKVAQNCGDIDNIEKFNRYYKSGENKIKIY